MLSELLLFLALPILIPGLVRTIRSRAANRRGPGIFQNLYDLTRQLSRPPVLSSHGTVIAELAPTFALAAALILWSLVVFGWGPWLLVPFLLTMIRIAQISFGMDNGTSFGGLGASREMMLSIFAEPVMILIVLFANSSLRMPFGLLEILPGFLFFLAAAVVILAEVLRAPFDDPRTHFELTMVHEAMLLEASGYSLGIWNLVSHLKLASLLVLLQKLFLEHTRFSRKVLPFWWEPVFILTGSLLLSVALGLWEANSVRRKWSKISEILAVSFVIILLLGTLFKLGNYAF